MEEFISIVVCTYNRGDILIDCLNALCNQTAPKSSYEIIVVDNNSKDDTKKITGEFSLKHSNVRYILETKQGLSHARNCGCINSKSDWVGYMDDDGKVTPDYIQETFKVINQFNFDCFGGRYIAWYNQKKPKWLNDSYGSSPVHLEQIGELKEGFNSGGIIFFRKQVLKDLNGFDPNYGMTGNKISYGEETHLQIRMREKGLSIGYSPFVLMEHLVAPYKLKLLWHIKSYYSHGRSNSGVWNVEPPGLLNTIKRSIMGFVKMYPKSLWKLVSQKGYYIQNVILDTYQPIAYLWGVYSAKK